MRGGLLALLFTAALFSSGPGMAACAGSRNAACSVNFDMVPQVSQDVVASEHSVAPVKPIPNFDPKNPYTGPTVGLAPNVHRAPTVGYKWAIN